MDHESLQLAIAPRAFPRSVSVFSVCRVGASGFAWGESVLGSDAAVPGRCRRCSVQDWQPTRTGSAPTLLQRDLCGYAANPARVFSAPAPGTGCGALLPDRGRSSHQERFPPYYVPQKRRGEVQMMGLAQKESNSWHSGRRPAATARVVETSEWDRARMPPQAILAGSCNTSSA